MTWRAAITLAVLTATVSACAATTTSDEEASVTGVRRAGGVLTAVQDSGSLRCGVRNDLPGFATIDAAGDYVGFDSDLCRAIAAGVLGDATAVDFVDVETADRFTALQSGEVDVLVRNTTWTASRDGGEAARFLQPSYYDGQGMMVAADSGFAALADMDSVIVCVSQGTTTEGNAAAEAERLGLDWEIRAFRNVDWLQEAFLAGQCDGWSADSSQLGGIRSALPVGPDAVTILPEVFSKEPLAPVVADGDSEWAVAVNWIMFAAIRAEEFGITSQNIDSFIGSDDIEIRRFLPADDEPVALDPGIGLPADFTAQVVGQVGNYGEIFDRNLTPLGIDRGDNASWTDGGLMYAPPYV